MKSMTGYGRSLHQRDQGKTPKGALALESTVRAVNGRFLEVRIHMPREWAELEPEVRTMVQSRVARGTVDLNISRARGTESAARVEVDERLATEWMKAYRKLAKATGMSGEIPFDIVARAPDVIKVVTDSAITPKEKQAVLSVAQEALDALDRERLREGEEIRQELGDLLGRLQAIVAKVEKVATDAPEDVQARLKTRMDRLHQSGVKTPGTDDPRFLQEVALLIDRGDIREEIARLAAHLNVYRGLLEFPDKTKSGAKSSRARSAGLSAGAPAGKTNEPVGKTLDFYAQELLREVNTVGSKSQNVELTRLVVEAKTLVEKIREQVQNIE